MQEGGVSLGKNLLFHLLREQFFYNQHQINSQNMKHKLFISPVFTILMVVVVPSIYSLVVDVQSVAFIVEGGGCRAPLKICGEIWGILERVLDCREQIRNFPTSAADTSHTPTCYFTYHSTADMSFNLILLINLRMYFFSH